MATSFLSPAQQRPTAIGEVHGSFLAFDLHEHPLCTYQEAKWTVTPEAADKINARLHRGARRSPRETSAMGSPIGRKSVQSLSKAKPLSPQTLIVGSFLSYVRMFVFVRCVFPGLFVLSPGDARKNPLGGRDSQNKRAASAKQVTCSHVTPMAKPCRAKAAEPSGLQGNRGSCRVRRPDLDEAAAVVLRAKAWTAKAAADGPVVTTLPALLDARAPAQNRAGTHAQRLASAGFNTPVRLRLVEPPPFACTIFASTLSAHLEVRSSVAEWGYIRQGLPRPRAPGSLQLFWQEELWWSFLNAYGICLVCVLKRSLECQCEAALSSTEPDLQLCLVTWAEDDATGHGLDATTGSLKAVTTLFF
ncbi:hypothetical protein HPB50_025119 [Hyalomma asiaticum]|uniref:Uncharacterized protein n=1 Tax=Hyalomma asiaticum TaxID=266040 RepID=A0ACB7RW98_HYAAI|nr:hypothetical protein HPB50_025119 [Hyalomma asiaticum]